MKKYLYAIIMFLATSLLFSAEIPSISTKQFLTLDEQHVFNSIKTIFRQQCHECVIDTYWDKIEIIHYTTKGYMDIEVIEKHLILSYDNTTQEYALQIFERIQDNTYTLSSDDILYDLLWNRIEYAFGISTSWMECSFGALTYITHPLCRIDKEFFP